MRRVSCEANNLEPLRRHSLLSRTSFRFPPQRRGNPFFYRPLRRKQVSVTDPVTTKHEKFERRSFNDLQFFSRESRMTRVGHNNA